MMQAIKQSRLESPWRYLVKTNSKSSTWAFDRLRLYDSGDTEVGIFENANFKTSRVGELKYVVGNPIDIQRFSSTGGFEHDFTFDLSSTTGLVTLAFRKKPSNANWQQMYCYPTGFAGTRGKNASILEINFMEFNPKTNGGDIGRLRVENNPFQVAYTGYYPIPIYAKEIRMNNPVYLGTVLSNKTIEKLIKGVYLSGNTGGVFDYGGQLAPENCLSEFNELKNNRGWNFYNSPTPTS